MNYVLKKSVRLNGLEKNSSLPEKKKEKERNKKKKTMAWFSYKLFLYDFIPFLLNIEVLQYLISLE